MVPQPAVANPSVVLGVTADAPLTLVERLYWKRAHALAEAERRGEPDARARMDELNAAHALLREAPAADLAATTGVAVRGARRGAALAVLACTIACVGAVGAAYGVMAGAAAFACGAVVTLVVGMRGAAPDVTARDANPRDALATLYLAPGAAADEVQLAYETLRDAALAGRSDRDAAVRDRLARLQAAYRSAMPIGGAAYRST